MKTNTITSSFENANELSIKYLQKLISFKSITPDNAGVHQWVQGKLESFGFNVENFSSNGVDNMVATRDGTGPGLIFSCHSDVVPAYQEEKWSSPPFKGNIVNNILIGRGAVDMKGAIACMLSAMEILVKNEETLPKLVFVMTSDEEGEAEFGSNEIVKYLISNNLLLPNCLIGEPTANEHSGDQIKASRRGAVTCSVTINGKQGHSAYPQFADNSLHKCSLIINNINQHQWQKDNDLHIDARTTVQATHIESSTSSENVIPGQTQFLLNIRYSYKYDLKDIKSEIEQIVAGTSDNYQLNWSRECEPYHSDIKQGTSLFFSAIEKAIFETTNHYPNLSSSGGTSDGRFFANSGCEVIELGLPCTTAHQINESVDINELFALESIYLNILRNIRTFNNG